MIFRNKAQYNLIDDQFANLWQIVFPGFENLDLQLVNTNIPFPQLTYEAKDYGLKTYKGISAPDSVSFTFREQESFEGFRFFQDWLNTIYDYNTHQYRTLTSESQKYKTATIQFVGKSLGPTFSIPNYSFQIKNLMPLGFSELPIENENGDPLQFTIQMTAESIEPIPGSSLTNDIAGNVIGGAGYIRSLTNTIL